VYLPEQLGRAIIIHFGNSKGGMLMSSYEILMITLTIASLIVAILKLERKK